MMASGDGALPSGEGTAGSGSAAVMPPLAASLVEPLLAGERRALARSITLVESTRDDHREAADALLQAVLPNTGRSPQGRSCFPKHQRMFEYVFAFRPSRAYFS